MPNAMMKSEFSNIITFNIYTINIWKTQPINEITAKHMKSHTFKLQMYS